MNIQTALTRCIETVHAARAAETAKTYKSGIDLFARMLGEDRDLLTADLGALSMEDFIRFPIWLRKRGYAKQTLNVYLAAAKFFMGWMVIGGHMAPDYHQTLRYEQAVKQVTSIRESKLPRFPQRNDVEQMKAAVRILPFETPVIERNIALIEFLASTGCRNSEAVNLLISDFSTEFDSAIVTGKGKKERRVFLSSATTELLHGYWKARGDASAPAPAFARHDKGAGKKIKKLTSQTVRTIVRQAAMTAGIETFTPHYFRHAFAIRVLAETGNLALTQDLLGHEHPDATRVYAKIYPDDMRKAHAQIFNAPSDNIVR